MITKIHGFSEKVSPEIWVSPMEIQEEIGRICKAIQAEQSGMSKGGRKDIVVTSCGIMIRIDLTHKMASVSGGCYYGPEKAAKSAAEEAIQFAIQKHSEKEKVSTK